MAYGRSPSSEPSPPTTKGAKRNKSSYSCLSCRKQKTRCETLGGERDNPASLRCHRCKVLNLQCSHETGETAPKESHSESSRSKASTLEDTDPLGLALGPPLNADGEAKRTYTNDRLWNFLVPDQDDMIDWAFPINGIYDVTNRMNITAPPSFPPPLHTGALNSIISSRQINELIAIFKHRYEPWLLFDLLEDDGDYPLLDLVRCTVAARHLPTNSRATVSERLNDLCNQTVSHVILYSRSAGTIECVQSLLILSLWTPIYEASRGGLPDSRALLSCCTSMAATLRLNRASSLLLQNDMESPHLLHKAKMWLAITVADSMSCMQTGRLPLARRSHSDRRLFQESNLQTVTGSRETRLRVLCELCDLADKGCCISCDPDSTEQWYKSFVGLIDSFNNVHHAMSPLVAVAEHEQQFFQMLRLQYHLSRMAVLYHVVFETKVNYCGNDVTNDWVDKIKVGGALIVPDMHRSLFQAAANVLETTAMADPSVLSTAPDCISPHCAIAAGLIVGFKVILRHIDEYSEIPRPEITDQLLVKVMKVLFQISFSPDQPSYKCYRLVKEMVSVWSKYLSQPDSRERHYAQLLPDSHADWLASAQSTFPTSRERHSILTQDVGMEVPPNADASHFSGAPQLSNFADHFAAFEQLVNGQLDPNIMQLWPDNSLLGGLAGL